MSLDEVDLDGAGVESIEIGGIMAFPQSGGRWPCQNSRPNLPCQWSGSEKPSGYSLFDVYVSGVISAPLPTSSFLWNDLMGGQKCVKHIKTPRMCLIIHEQCWVIWVRALGFAITKWVCRSFLHLQCVHHQMWLGIARLCRALFFLRYVRSRPSC